MIRKLDMIAELSEILGFDSTQIKQNSRKLVSWDSSTQKANSISQVKNNTTLTGMIGDCDSISGSNGAIVILEQSLAHEIVKGLRKKVAYTSEWVINFSGTPVTNDFVMTAKFMFGVHKALFLKNLVAIKNQLNWTSLVTIYGIEDSDTDETVATKLATQYFTYWYDQPEFEESQVEFSILHGPVVDGYRVKLQLVVNNQNIVPQNVVLEITPLDNEFTLRKYGYYGNEHEILLQSDYRMRGNKFRHIRDPRNLRIFAKCSYKEAGTGIVRSVTTTINNIPVQNTLLPFDYKGDYVKNKP